MKNAAERERKPAGQAISASHLAGGMTTITQMLTAGRANNRRSRESRKVLFLA